MIKPNNTNFTPWYFKSTGFFCLHATYSWLAHNPRTNQRLKSVDLRPIRNVSRLRRSKRKFRSPGKWNLFPPRNIFFFLPSNIAAMQNRFDFLMSRDNFKGVTFCYWLCHRWRDFDFFILDRGTFEGNVWEKNTDMFRVLPVKTLILSQKMVSTRSRDKRNVNRERTKYEIST